jgi:hypothetical protein
MVLEEAMVVSYDRLRDDDDDDDYDDVYQSVNSA